jgi:hypothetical protein
VTRLLGQPRTLCLGHRHRRKVARLFRWQFRFKQHSAAFTPHTHQRALGGRCRFEFVSVSAFILAATCALSAIVASLASSRPHDPRRCGLRLPAVNGTTAVEFPPFYSPATHSGIGISSTFNRRRSDASHAVRGRSSVFSRQFRAADRPFFSGSFLLSLAAPPSLVRCYRWTGSIRVLLERNPPKRPLVPGGASAF